MAPDKGEEPGLSRWAQGNHKALCKREAGGSETEKRQSDDGSRKRESLENAVLLALRTEEVAKAKGFR